jgi:hypothetical protein
LRRRELRCRAPRRCSSGHRASHRRASRHCASRLRALCRCASGRCASHRRCCIDNGNDETGWVDNAQT